jgi:hypothetical protein
MAQKFLTNIDLNQNQILNATFEVLATNPSTNLFDGRMYFDSAEGVIKIYDASATSWRKIVAGYDGVTAGVISAGTHALSLTITEDNGQITVTPNLATSSNAGLLSSTFYDDLNTATSAATASKLVKRDASGNISVATPSADGHAATKGYVDAARSGLDVKDSVRAATTTAGTLSTSFANGSVVDGVTLATGNRILIKDQNTGSENGIYTVNASGSPTRATDADTSAEVTAGMFTFVAEGTTNADSGWVLTTNDTITLGTTALTFAQFSGAGQITAGDGLTKTGSTINAVGTADRITANADSIDIASTYAGQSTITTLGTITTGVWGSGATDIAVASGGTGASTAADARTNLGIKTSVGTATTSTSSLARVAKQACAASAAGTSSTVVTHLFNSLDVIVQIYEVSSGATVIGDTVRTNADTVTVTLLGTITAGDYVIVVTG